MDIDKVESENLHDVLAELDRNIQSESRQDLLKLRRERLGDDILFLLDRAYHLRQSKASWQELYHGEPCLVEVVITRLS
jgi:hypothetical protein